MAEIRDYVKHHDDYMMIAEASQDIDWITICGLLDRSMCLKLYEIKEVEKIKQFKKTSGEILCGINL